MRSFLIIFGVLLVFCLACGTAAQVRKTTEQIDLDIRKYKSDAYDVSQKTHVLGDIVVEMVQIHKLKDRRTIPHCCRAWIKVRRKGQILKQIYFDDIDPIGASYGLFLPAKQPVKDLFIVIKLGDYDGRLIMVDENGKVTDLIGGSFFLTKNGRFLFSQYHSDVGGATVIDLKSKRAVFSETEIPHIDQWYRDKNKVFYEEIRYGDKGCCTGVLQIYDFSKHTFIETQATEENLSKSEKVDFYFDAESDTLSSCTFKKHKS